MSQDWLRVEAQLTLGGDPEALDATFAVGADLATAVVGELTGALGAGADIDVGADVDVVVGAVVVVEREAFVAAGKLEPQAAARRTTASRANSACEALRRRCFRGWYDSVVPWFLPCDTCHSFAWAGRSPRFRVVASGRACYSYRAKVNAS
jgi:hypothetical protein